MKELRHAHPPGSNHPLALAGRDVVGIAQHRYRKTACLRASDPAAFGKTAPGCSSKTCRVLGALARPANLSGQILDSLGLWPPHPPLLGAGDRRRADEAAGPLGDVRRPSLVSTPVRLLDLVQSNGWKLNQSISWCRERLPHARRGFHNDIRQNSSPSADQAPDLFFSANDPPGIIADSPNRLLRDPARVS